VALQWDGSAWLAPVAVDGMATPFLVDTGAERSMLFADAVKRLNVPRDEWAATATRGVGGIVELPNADPRSLTLGGIPLRRRTVAADNTLTVGIAGPGPADGLLGQDLLSPFDLDFDGVHDTLGLYAAASCLDPAALPWTGPRAAIPVERVFRNVLLIPVTVDGYVLQALIDSGAGTSLVTITGMAKLGLTDASLAADPSREARGIGPRAVTIRLHRFGRVAVGPQIFTDQPLWVGPARLAPSIDMLLGADWLRGRRVWFSFAANTVVVSLDPAARNFGP
jgi:hypothetical protein